MTLLDSANQDVSHVNTSATCKGYGPDQDGLQKTLDGAGIVLIPAGVPRKPGMSRDDLFNVGPHLILSL